MDTRIKLNDLVRAIVAVMLFLTISAFFFWPYLEGKRIMQPDMLQFQGMTQEILQYEKITGVKALWTNSMFGGMPTYQINTPHKGNYLALINQILQLGTINPIGLIFTGMFSFYLLLLVLKLDYRLAIIGGILFGLVTNNMILYEAGHISKLRSIAYLPLLLAGMILIFRKKYGWGFFIFSFGFGLNLLANHVQMTYYFFLLLPMLIILVAFKFRKENNLRHLWKSIGIMLIGSLLALASAVSNLWPTYEYSKETNRGNAVINTPGDEWSDSTMIVSPASGLNWENSMQWSNGWLDILACIIPGAAGSATSARIHPNSRVYEVLADHRSTDPGEITAPLYWGSLPFTGGPGYVGASLFYLFLLGIFLVRGPLKWWTLCSSILLTLISLGKNFPFLNKLLFDHLPFYNNFRAPNSIMSILPLVVIFLGILSLQQILNHNAREKILQVNQKVGIRMMIILLFLAVLGPELFSFLSSLDPYYESAGWETDQLIRARKSMFRWDAFRTIFFTGAIFLIVLIFIRYQFNSWWFLFSIAALSIIDFWTVNRRFINDGVFQDGRKYERFYTPRNIDLQIRSDPDPHYRVLDLTSDPFNSAFASYFHKSVGGYHAAKLRRYQDVIDHYLSRGDRAVLNMLNTRYLIQPGDQGKEPFVAKNEEALGHAWMVDSIVMAGTAEEELILLDSIDPGRMAIVHREFDTYLKDFHSGGKGNIRLIQYLPDQLTYEVSSDHEGLYVFSEIWYGPDKGWQAYLDGSPVPHIRVNYLLRGLMIPPGLHTVEFLFRPTSFYTGRTISRISSSFILYGFLWFLGFIHFVRPGAIKSKKEISGLNMDPLLDFPAVPGAEKGKSEIITETPLTGEVVRDYTNRELSQTQKWHPLLFKVVASLILITMLYLSTGSGINADEEYQIGYSEKLIDFYRTFGRDTSALFIEKGNMHFYGGFFEILAGSINHAIGFGVDDAGYYTTRKILVSIFGFLTILFTSLLAKHLGGWRAGIITLLFMFLSPRFLGHSLMNPKDIPFAAGYIMTIYFIVLYFSRLHENKWIPVAGIIAGMGISIGTRVGGMMLFAFLFLYLLLHHLFERKNIPNKWLNLKGLIFTCFGICLLGYIMAIFFWPAALVSPVSFPLYALTHFEDLNVYINLLFKGLNVMSNQVTRDYLLIWIWKTIPVFVLAGLTGSILLFRSLLNGRNQLPLILVWISALFPVLYLLIKQSVLHDGWRHLIFIYPSMVVLAVLFWNHVFEKYSGNKNLLRIIYGTLFLLCLEPAIFILRNPRFPYVYFNPLAGGLEKSFGNFETDYWGVSVKQAVDWLEDQKILSESMSDTLVIASSFSYNLGRQLGRAYRDKVRVKYVRYQDRYNEDWDYGIFPSRFVPGKLIRQGFWPPAETIHTVDANKVPLLAIIQNVREEFQLGMEAVRNEDWSSGLRLLENALRKYPGDPEILKALANVQRQVGDYDGAKEKLDRWKQINGPTAEYYTLMSDVYLAGGELDEAKNAAFQAIGFQKDFYPALYILALVYQKEGNTKAALDYALRSVQINPMLTEAYLTVSQLYESQGLYDQSIYFRNEHLRLLESDKGR